MKKTLFLTLILVSVLVFLIRYSGPAAELILGIKARSGISIISDPEGAVVFMESKEVGKTPYEDKNLDVKEYNVKLERGKGMTVISNPSDSEVEVDGKIYGKTPINIDVAAGEHTIVISHTSYLKRSIRANLPENFNLTISADLALSEADLTSVSAPVITQTPEVEVIDTPTGFLRVRDKASTAGKEITRVNVGDTLILLEELS